MKLIKTADVFCRRYGENTLVYKTSKCKVFIMNGVCFDIINAFKEKNEISNCLDYINRIYNIDDFENARPKLESFINELINNEILEKPYTMLKKDFDINYEINHSNIIPKGSLKHVMFELTYRCNEKCKHCYCVASEKEKELTLDEIENILDQLDEMNVLEVTFTGGDLFVRGDSFDILDYAYKKGLLINIFTNGIALKEDDFYHLQRIHPKSVSFSLYNYIPEKHDAFTRVDGSFVKTTKAIQKCVALGIPVNVKTSIVNDNIDDINGILELVKSLKAQSQMSMSISPKNDGNISNTSNRLNDIQKYIKALEIINDNLEVEHIEKQNNIFEEIKTRRVCWAGDSSISIDPFGNVYPCNALPIKCGNVKEKSIKNIWNNSKELKEVRSYTVDMIKGCDDCDKKNKCAFCLGTSYQHSNDPLVKYDEACNITEALINYRKEKI